MKFPLPISDKPQKVINSIKQEYKYLVEYLNLFLFHSNAYNERKKRSDQ